MKKSDHLHTYERSKTNQKIYRCISPDCSHYHNVEFLVGKYALCPKCGEKFILERSMLIGNFSVKTPTCLHCSNSKRAKEFRRLTDTVQSVLDALGD